MITITMRLTLRKIKADLVDAGRNMEARVLDQVLYIDGFPHSYTDEARDLADKLLANPSDEAALHAMRELMDRDGVLKR